MLFISLDEAKRILKHLAMETAIANVGVEVDASVAFKSCADRLESWLNCIPAYEMETGRCAQRFSSEALAYLAEGDCENLVKEEIALKMAQWLTKEGRISFKKTEDQKRNQVIFEATVRILKNESTIRIRKEEDVLKCDT